MCLQGLMKFHHCLLKILYGKTDGQYENSILPHKHSFSGGGGGIKIVLGKGKENNLLMLALCIFIIQRHLDCNLKHT